MQCVVKKGNTVEKKCEIKNHVQSKVVIETDCLRGWDHFN